MEKPFFLMPEDIPLIEATTLDDVLIDGTELDFRIREALGGDTPRLQEI